MQTNCFVEDDTCRAHDVPELGDAVVVVDVVGLLEDEGVGDGDGCGFVYPGGWGGAEEGGEECVDVEG